MWLSWSSRLAIKFAAQKCEEPYQSLIKMCLCEKVGRALFPMFGTATAG